MQGAAVAVMVAVVVVGSSSGSGSGSRYIAAMGVLLQPTVIIVAEVALLAPFPLVLLTLFPFSCPHHPLYYTTRGSTRYQ